MAKARFEYEISSKDKSKAGVDSAKRGISGLGEATQKTANIMKAALAGISLVAITKGIQKVTQLYAEQQKVEIRLQAAVKNNPMLNGGAAKRLTEYASALQQSSVYGDEAIIQQQSMLAALGLAEDQINAVMEASIDLASSGMMSLESATRNIAKSFSGMTGELGEAIPALRDLTAEELKAGKAVDLIKQQFGGMGQAMANSFEGQVQQMKNTIGDIGETIGGALAPIGSAIITSLKPALDGIARWFTDNQTQIINFFTHFPEIGRVSLLTLRDILGKIFSWEYLKTLGEALWKYFLAAGQSALTFLSSVLNAIGQTIWQPLKFGWDMMIYGIKQAFAGFINWFVDKINWVVEQGKKAGLFGNAEILQRAGGTIPTPTFAGNEIKDAWAEAGGAFTDHMTNIFEAATTLGEEIGGPLGDVFAEYLPEFKELLNAPGKYTKPNLPASTAGGGSGSSDGEAALVGIMESFEQGQRDWRDRAMAVFDEIDASVSGLVGKLPALGQIVSDLLMKFWNLITSTESFQDLLEQVNNALQLIVEDVVLPLYNAVKPLLDVLLSFLATFTTTILPLIDMIAQLFAALAPVIETVGDVIISLTKVVIQLLAPLFSIFEILINAYHPILKALIPIFDAWGMVVSALVPIFDMLGYVVKVVATPIATLGAFFQWLGNLMYNFGKFIKNFINHPLKPSKWDDGMKSTNLGKMISTAVAAVWDSGDTSDYTSSFEGSETSTSTGGAASYTAGRTINQTVNIYTDVIAGEGGIRDLAIMIRDEIYSAEALGA